MIERYELDEKEFPDGKKSLKKFSMKDGETFSKFNLISGNHGTGKSELLCRLGGVIGKPNSPLVHTESYSIRYRYTENLYDCQRIEMAWKRFMKTVAPEVDPFTFRSISSVGDSKLTFLENFDYPFLGVLFTVDCIDGELHHSILEKTLKALMRYILDLRGQIFMVTQRYDTLTAAVTAFGDNELFQQNFRYIRLDKVPNEEGHTRAKCFTYERLLDNIEKDIEVRG